MKQRVKTVFLGGAAVLAGWIAWGLYSTWSTESVPYERLRTVDGVELRRYPETVTVETTAPDGRTAFRRLFRYLSGANASGQSVSMTTPVETQGESIAMTTPVRSRSSDTATANDTDHTDGMRMAFYLPAEYTPDRAPTPTDPSVRLVVEPAEQVGRVCVSLDDRSGLRIEQENRDTEGVKNLLIDVQPLLAFALRHARFGSIHGAGWGFRTEPEWPRS